MGLGLGFGGTCTYNTTEPHSRRYLVRPEKG